MSPDLAELRAVDILSRSRVETDKLLRYCKTIANIDIATKDKPTTIEST